MKRFFLLSTSEGCATNLAETAGLRRHYRANGMEPAERIEDADLVLVNTCAYNDEMEARASGKIGELKAKFPEKEIIIAGCYPKINPARFKQDLGDRALIPPPAIDPNDFPATFDKNDFSKLSPAHRFLFVLRWLVRRLERTAKREFQPLSNIVHSAVVNETFRLITVSTGCLGQCTYCGIRRAKGSLKSRPLAVVLAEFDQAIAGGNSKFWFLADDLGCWGQDIGSNLPELLKALLARNGNFEFVLNFIHPSYLEQYAEELIPLLSDRRIRCINVPIQSGSPTVLEQMGRHYDLARVRGILARIRKTNPALAMKTDLMVGFAGESWSDYFRTVQVAFDFDAIFVRRYAPRPQTRAAAYADQVSEPMKHLRWACLQLFVGFRHTFVLLRSLLWPA